METRGRCCEMILTYCLRLVTSGSTKIVNAAVGDRAEVFVVIASILSKY
jgi:hypothetical protein